MGPHRAPAWAAAAPGLIDAAAAALISGAGRRGCLPGRAAGAARSRQEPPPAVPSSNTRPRGQEPAAGQCVGLAAFLGAPQSPSLGSRRARADRCRSSGADLRSRSPRLHPGHAAGAASGAPLNTRPACPNRTHGAGRKESYLYAETKRTTEKGCGARRFRCTAAGVPRWLSNGAAGRRRA